MARSVAIALVLPAVLAGCGGVAKVQAPNSRDRALLSSILHGMKTDLVSVRIGDPAKMWGARPGRKFLYVTPATAKTPDGVAGDWYGTLIAGAYQARCDGRADCLVGFDVEGWGGGRLGTSRNRPPHASTRSVAREIRRRFASRGFHVTSISFQRPWGLAAVVTVTARHPQRAVTAYRAVRLDHLPIEGIFVRMLDAHGAVFLVAAGSDRTHTGEGWVRPGLKVPGMDMGVTGTNGPTGTNSPLGPPGPHGP